MAHPHLRPLELNLLRLKKKIDAGADFLLTQPVFDLAAFTSWMDAVRAAGLDQRAAIIASVLPLTSVEQAETLRQRQDLRAARRSRRGPVGRGLRPGQRGPGHGGRGGRAAQDASPGVRGIHILSGGCEALAGQVIQAAGLA